MTVIIVGTQRSTRRALARRAEIAVCRPGEKLELRRERGTRGGRPAVGVYSPRGIEIGYLWPDHAAPVAGLLSIAKVIFHAAENFGAVARVTFDGSAPTLPKPKPKPVRNDPRRPLADEFCDIFPVQRAG